MRVYHHWPNGGKVQRTWAIAATLSGAALIAFAPILVRLSELGPQATAFWRLAIGAAVLLALTFSLPKSAAPSPKMRDTLLLAGLFFALDLACWHAAIKLTSVVNATLLANLTPVAAGIGGWLLFRERVSKAWLVGASVAITGAVMLASSRHSGGQGSAWGDALAVITTLWYAAYMIAIRRARAHVAVLTAMTWSTCAAAVIALPIALASGEALVPADARGWAILIALGGLVHVAGQGGIAFGLGRLPVAITSVVILVQPVISAALGWRIFGEAIAPLGIVGGALVLFGAWAAQRPSIRASPPAQRPS